MSGVSRGGYGVASSVRVEDEGSDLAARGRINFTGAGVTATDDPSNDRINVAIPGGGGGGGTGIDPAIIDAKGDLIVGSGPDSPVRQAVGANGTFLSADSSQAGGVAWVTIAGQLAVVAALDATKTGGQNRAALQAAITAAEAAAANGTSVRVIAKAGTFKLDYATHTLLTAPATLSGTFTLSVKDTSDFPSSGSLRVTDPAFDNSQTILTTATVTYTGKTATSFTGCTVTTGSGQTFPVGAAVASGAGETERGIVLVPNGGIHLDMPGVELDVSDAVLTDQGNLGPGIGPQALKIGGDTQAASRRWLRSAAWPLFQVVKVGASVQPNTNIDGSYSAGEFSPDDTVLLMADGTGDYDAGRTNPIGENVVVADPREFSTRSSGALAASQVANLGSTSFTVKAMLDNRYFPDPNDSSTTLSASLASGAGQISVANAGNLVLRERINVDQFKVSSGLALIDDGTNREVVYFDGVDRDNNVLLNVTRAKYGTTSPASFASGTAIRLIGLMVMQGELMAYSKVASGTTITLRMRGLSGTTITSVAAGASAYIFYVPAPGEVMLRNPIQIGPYLHGRNDPPATNTQVALGATFTEGSQVVVECEDCRFFAPYGAIQIGSEIMTYAWRDAGKFYGVTRGVQGTTVASHSVAQPVTQVPLGVKVTAALANNGTSVSVNGANTPLFAPGGSAKYVRINLEILQMKSGEGSSSTSGQQYVTTTTTTALAATDTTIALTDASSFVDPVALGIGWAFAKIDDASGVEIVSYTGKSGNSLTGVKRGYASSALAHTTGKNVRQVKTLNLTNSGRGLADTTAATAAVGDRVVQVEPSFLQRLSLARKVRVTGLKISCQKSTRSVIPRVNTGLGDFYGNRISAVATYYAKDLVFENMGISRVERDGFLLNNSMDVEVADCLIEHCNQQGAGNSVNLVGACNDVSVDGNTMRDVRHGGKVSAAPDAQGLPLRVNFTNNRVEDCINAGWETQASGSQVKVSDNTFIGIAGGGGVLANGPGTEIHHNTIRSTQGYGVQIQDFSKRYGTYTVEGNLIEDCATGILFSVQDTGDVSGALTSVIIRGNTLRRCKLQGIRVSNDATVLTGLRIQGLTIVGNVIQGGPQNVSSLGDGAMIYVNKVAAALIADNQVFQVGPDAEGIYLTTGDRSVVQGNVVQFRAASSKDGIVVISAPNSVVAANQVMNAGSGLGINIGGDATITAGLNNPVAA